jgi:hypothetical protein
VPGEVVERECDDLAAAKPVRRDEQQHGVIASADCARTIDALQKRANRFPSQRAWQLLLSIDAWRIDLATASTRVRRLIT